MVPRVIEVKYVKGYTLWLRFDDGLQGKINLEDDLWGEVFEPLRNEDQFADVRLDPLMGTTTWPNGADFAPEHLRQLLEKTLPLSHG